MLPSHQPKSILFSENRSAAAHPGMSSSRLRELIANKWRRLASKGARRRSKGHFAVYANGGKRFVVPLRYLDHPIFRVLLELAEEEFGTVARGPLRVPCEEELMEHLVSLMATSFLAAGGRIRQL